MTSCKGQLIHIVLQSMLRLISIHCNYSSCSEFGQCFPQPKWFVTKKVAHEEKPKTSLRFLTLRYTDVS